MLGRPGLLDEHPASRRANKQFGMVIIIMIQW